MSTSHVALGKGDASSTLSQSHNNSRGGDGYREDWPLDISAWRDKNFKILTDATTPFVEMSNSEARATWAATVVDPAVASMRIDGCAQQTWSEYQVIGCFLQTGSTDTITVSLTAIATRPGVGTVGTFTIVRSITKGNALAPEEIFFNFSELVDGNKNRLQPGDLVTFALTPSAHGTDALYMYGSTFRRARNPALTYTGLGNGGANASGHDHRVYDYGAT